jgi:transaldolase
MDSLTKLKTKIFADGADFEGIMQMYRNPLIRGFTTNPTLMRKAGISDYEGFAGRVLAAVSDRPVSFEVFADDFPEMIRQGKAIGSWASNVNVKIPVTNTTGVFCGPVIRELSHAGIAVNVTAVMTLGQVGQIVDCLAPRTPAIISIFAGRIADTGRDPVPLMQEALNVMQVRPLAELIWASPRELLNIFQADAIGCHIITVTNDLLAKLALVGKNLDEYSLDTVLMFRRDAVAANYHISAPVPSPPPGQGARDESRDGARVGEAVSSSLAAL